MPNTHETVREFLTVYADLSGGAFDETNLDPIAIAQGYSLSINGETEDLVIQDLADALNTVWANPEVVKKAWSLSTDSLVLRPNATTGDVDATNKLTSIDLRTKIGDVIHIALMDSNAQVGDTYLRGEAVITSFEQSGTVGEFATYSISFEGKNAIIEETHL